MPALFHPRANLIARGSLAVLGTGLAAVIATWFGFSGSFYDTREALSLWQPVPFSHAHHAGELGIDCRYCHSSVETSASAGMPSTDVCANCHWQIWTDAEMLEPVRASWREGSRLRWNRVYDTPDYVYFEHSVHVKAGVSCEVCHGAVDRMPLIYKAADHTMQWCLDCHRDPWSRIGTRPLLTSPVPSLAAASGSSGGGAHAALAARVDAAGLTSCTTCHR